MTDCIFCKIIAGEVPAHKVYENDKIFAFLDQGPVSPGHTLVVPRAHHKDVIETPEEVLQDMITRAKKIAVGIMKGVKADGFNIIINTRPEANQLVFHTHLHIVPRFKGDGLKYTWPKKNFSPEEMGRIRDDIKANIQ